MPRCSRHSDMTSHEADGGSQREPLAQLRALEGRREPAMVRVRMEPAYVLTTWPWKETSLIAEMFTRHHGRVSLAVRGAKRPGGKFRGLINPFCPLLVNYSGRTEVKNLTDARWMGGLAPLNGEGFLSAYYLNELIIRLCAKEDPHPELFDAYTRALGALAEASGLKVQPILRLFEVDLLKILGWGQNDDGQAQAWRVRDGELVPASPSDPEAVSCAVARAIFQSDFSDPSVLKPAQRALRQIIGYHVGDKGLSTRRTLSKWQQI